jgi:hypothetical protein
MDDGFIRGMTAGARSAGCSFGEINSRRSSVAVCSLGSPCCAAIYLPARRQVHAAGGSRSCRDGNARRLGSCARAAQSSYWRGHVFRPSRKACGGRCSMGRDLLRRTSTCAVPAVGQRIFIPGRDRVQWHVVANDHDHQSEPRDDADRLLITDFFRAGCSLGRAPISTTTAEAPPQAGSPAPAISGRPIRPLRLTGPNMST